MIYYFFWVIISLMTSYLIAWGLTSLKKEPLHPQQQRYGHIDGLRGILSIFVFFHHFYIFSIWQSGNPWVAPDNIIIQNFGAVSVKLFFMITAYIFSKKVILKNGHDFSWKKLYISRCFRIIPLYFTSVLITFVYSIAIGHPSYSELFSTKGIKAIIKWIFFIGDSFPWYADAGYITSGVTWTLRYEWIFYLLLPVFHFIISKKLGIVTLIAFAIALFSGCKVPLISLDNFVPFLFGYFAAIISANSHMLKILYFFRKTPFIIWVALFLFIKSNIFHGIAITIPIFFIFLKIVLPYQESTLLTNKATLYLGKISYSIYLLHGMVIFFIHDFLKVNIEFFMIPIITATVIVISSITYYIIERPFIFLGKRAILK